MNQVFSFKRYWWLLKRQWYENAAIYKWGIVLLVLVTGLLFGLFGDWKLVDNHYHFSPLRHHQTFIVLIFFFFIYAAWFFESLSSKHKRIFNFSLPVKPLERVAVTFTFVMLLMPVLILTVFNVFDFAAVQLFNHIHGTSVQMFLNYHTSKLIIFLNYLFIASIFTLGSLMFGKKGPVISITFIIVLFYIYFKLSIWFGISTHIDFPKNSIIIYFLPVWWVLMFFVMKKKEA